MAKYSDVLLTSDYDRTLTAPDASIPEKNLEAIRYFMENGGEGISFCVFVYNVQP